jgi:renalase
MFMRFAIIGAGMAGLSCAQALKQDGHSITLFDKARGPGGRMSTRRIRSAAGEIAFDHGAQYFTARDPDFAEQVSAWAELGVVARWPEAGEDAWVGSPAMNTPIRALADLHDVRWNLRIDVITWNGHWGLEREAGLEGRFDALIVAVPAEQVAPLVESFDQALAEAARSTLSDPCWTVMVAFDRPLPFQGDIVRDAGIVGWAARNSAKPGRSGPEAWVVQGSPDWSREHLEDDGLSVEHALLGGLAEAIGATLPKPLVQTAHRWRFARSGRFGRGALWNGEHHLGVCGDWLIGPRVEAAWISGREMAALACREAV